jgi:hypothetical protein
LQVREEEQDGKKTMIVDGGAAEAAVKAEAADKNFYL